MQQNDGSHAVSSFGGSGWHKGGSVSHRGAAAAAPLLIPPPCATHLPFACMLDCWLTWPPPCPDPLTYAGRSLCGLLHALHWCC